MKDARSAASVMKSVLKPASSPPLRPAALPKTPKVRAASRVWFLDWPRLVALALYCRYPAPSLPTFDYASGGFQLQLPVNERGNKRCSPFLYTLEARSVIVMG